MANNSQDELVVSIVLDDGSIQKGFFTVQKKADETGKKVASSFDKATDALKDGLEEAAPGFVSLGKKIAAAVTSPFGLITAGVVGIGLAFEKAFDLTLAGEKLNKIDKQFKALTESFGVAGEQLKSKFVGSLGGLVVDSEAVKSLNKALVLLGDKAEQLPRVMDLARKATSLFGGEVTDNFEAINQAIASGATRQLRGLGIVIKADEAYTKYAKSLGISKDALTEAGRQQAILNEVLEKGEKRFSTINTNSETATTALQKFKVATTNSFEEIEKSFANNLGPVFERIINKATEIVQKGESLGDLARVFINPTEGLSNLAIKYADAATGSDIFTLSTKELKKKIEETQDSIGKFDRTIESLTAVKEGTDDKGLIRRTNRDIGDLKLQSQAAGLELTKLFSALSKRTANDTDLTLFGPKATKPNEGLDVDQKKATEERKTRERELTTFLLEQQTARVAAEVAAADASETFFDQVKDFKLSAADAEAAKLAGIEEQIFAIQQASNSQQALLAQQQKSKLLEIEQKFSADKNFSVQERESAISALEQNFATQRESQAAASADKIKKLEDKQNEERIARAKQFSEAINQALVSIASNGLQRIGQALVNGSAAFDDFGQAVLGVIADTAIHLGELLLAAGLGINSLAESLASFNGFAAIAAGAALIVIGSAIKALTTKSPSGAPSSGGGIATGSSPTTDLSPTSNFANPAANTQVQVVVQGSIYDSDETGSRIVDLINTAFDKKGVVIQQGVVA